jgi:hypothetical protein
LTGPNPKLSVTNGVIPLCKITPTTIKINEEDSNVANKKIAKKL